MPDLFFSPFRSTLLSPPHLLSHLPKGQKHLAMVEWDQSTTTKPSGELQARPQLAQCHGQRIRNLGKEENSEMSRSHHQCVSLRKYGAACSEVRYPREISRFNVRFFLFPLPLLTQA